MKQNILIVGHGEIGQAISFLLRKMHAQSIDCWDIDPKQCPTRKGLQELVEHADILFCCVPSWSLKDVASSVRPHLRKKTILVTLSKGLDKTTHKTVDQLMQSLFPEHARRVLMSGPMLAEEITSDKGGSCVAASKDAGSRKTIASLFQGTKLRIVPSNDVVGASLCGVLKNVYAIGLGVAAAKDAGDNFRGWYIQQATNEMFRLLELAGADPRTAYGPAGLGDLIATGSSPYSTNFSYGNSLANGTKHEKKAEGAESFASLLRSTKGRKKEFPLLYAINDILRGKRRPATLLD